ncbi:hypothetical protein [uncultured Adlercreutzia sp.]|uniref:hypothetical protein n=1 Tax=uncultured Adlercreutzia sp. TaxID=875803 RepID=UPI0026F3FCE9|nr:hypothetical protein [uncultured Adlercreutzia sp.]
MIAPAPDALHRAVAEFSPYLDSYWEDCGSDDVRCVYAEAVFTDSKGQMVGVSSHCNPVSEEQGREFLASLLDRADSNGMDVAEVRR